VDRFFVEDWFKRVDSSVGIVPLAHKGWVPIDERSAKACDPTNESFDCAAEEAMALRSPHSSVVRTLDSILVAALIVDREAGRKAA
jgi:hypothetical protein